MVLLKRSPHASPWSAYLCLVTTKCVRLSVHNGTGKNKLSKNIRQHIHIYYLIFESCKTYISSHEDFIMLSNATYNLLDHD